MKSQLVALALTTTLFTTTASAQTITTLVKDGDVISTYGTVTDVLQVAVNNSGQWLVHANTVLPTASSFVVVRGGTAYLHQGQALVPGGALSFVGPVSIDSAGNATWPLFMSSLPSTIDSGVFFNASLVIQEGDISLATTG